MAMTTGQTGGQMSEINVTPLVDVMLVLLIIFMVATPLIEQERAEQELAENRDEQQRLLALNLPVRTDTPPPQNDDELKTVTIRITEGLEIRLGERQVASCAGISDKRAWTPCFDATREALAADTAAKQYGVTVDADPRVPFGFVVGVMHRVNLAGITKVGMFPRP